MDFNASLLNWEWPFSRDVLIEIFEVAINLKLVLPCVGEFNEMAPPRQTSGVRGDSDIELVSNLTQFDRPCLAIDCDSERIEGAGFVPLCRRWFDSQLTMDAAIEETVLVGDQDSFSDMNCPIPVHVYQRVETLNSIGGLWGKRCRTYKKYEA